MALDVPEARGRQPRPRQVVGREEEQRIDRVVEGVAALPQEAGQLPAATGQLGDVEIGEEPADGQRQVEEHPAPFHQDDAALGGSLGRPGHGVWIPAQHQEPAGHGVGGGQALDAGPEARHQGPGHPPPVRVEEGGEEQVVLPRKNRQPPGIELQLPLLQPADHRVQQADHGQAHPVRRVTGSASGGAAFRGTPPGPGCPCRLRPSGLGLRARLAPDPGSGIGLRRRRGRGARSGGHRPLEGCADGGAGTGQPPGVQPQGGPIQGGRFLQQAPLPGHGPAVDPDLHGHRVVGAGQHVDVGQPAGGDGAQVAVQAQVHRRVDGGHPVGRLGRKPPGHGHPQGQVEEAFLDHVRRRAVGGQGQPVAVSLGEGLPGRGHQLGQVGAQGAVAEDGEQAEPHPLQDLLRPDALVAVADPGGGQGGQGARRGARCVAVHRQAPGEAGGQHGRQRLPPAQGTGPAGPLEDLHDPGVMEQGDALFHRHPVGGREVGGAGRAGPVTPVLRPGRGVGAGGAISRRPWGARRGAGEEAGPFGGHRLGGDPQAPQVPHRSHQAGVQGLGQAGPQDLAQQQGVADQGRRAPGGDGGP